MLEGSGKERRAGGRFAFRVVRKWCEMLRAAEMLEAGRKVMM